MIILFFILALILSFILGWLFRDIFKKDEVGMDLNEFAKLITKIEGKKRSVDIAQIKEILKIANELLDGKLYKLIKGES